MTLQNDVPRCDASRLLKPLETMVLQDDASGCQTSRILKHLKTMILPDDASGCQASRPLKHLKIMTLPVDACGSDASRLLKHLKTMILRSLIFNLSKISNHLVMRFLSFVMMPFWVEFSFCFSSCDANFLALENSSILM